VRRLEETHGPVFELTRHFLTRMFDSELFAGRDRWRPVAIGAFMLLLHTAVLLPKAARYQRLFRLPAPDLLRAPLLANELADEAGQITLFLAIAGLLAMLQWQMLLPSRRDYMALASLPIRPRQIFLARFVAFLVFAAGVVAALNAPLSLMAPSRGAASALACVFALFSMVALQGALANLLPAKLHARVSAYVQGVLSAAFFLAALESWHIGDRPEQAVALFPQFPWAPPVWFAGLQQALAGNRDPFLRAMAGRAMVATGCAVTLAVLAYFVSYRRYRKLMVESGSAVESPSVRQWSIAGLLAREPHQAAVFHFMDTALARSRTHRLLLLGYGGLALGILLNSVLLALAASKWEIDWDTMLRFMTLYWPLAASMIFIPGMRHALSIPVDLGGNWIFRMTESQGRAQWMSAVERFVMLYAILPIYVLLAPAAVMTMGWSVAARMMALQALVSLTISELLFYNWQQLPFACSYAPGKKPLTSVIGSYMAAVFFLAPALSIIIAALSQLTATFLFGLTLFLAAWLGARRQRRQGWGDAKLIWEDVPEALADLGLKD
jgi:hypothetical protein